MNILSGLYRPDAGTVRLDGRVVPPGDRSWRWIMASA
ncbi:hypothetical protein ACFQ4K_23440 [Tistrella bauzanensis]